MKLWKKVCSFVAACCLCFGFTACGNSDGGDANAYTLIVKDANGNTLSGVSIGLCVYDATKEDDKGTCLPPKTTDANGKVVFDASTNAVEGKYVLSENEPNYQWKEHYIVESYGEYTVILIAE